MWLRIGCIAIGYLFGLFQTSYIYGRLHGIDIRNYGSGNAGTTNMLRTLGTKAGILTFFGDCLKCILAVLLVSLLFGESHREMLPLLKMYTAAGTILGHNFPFYLKFKGGKGIAATAGLIISFGPIMIVLGLITFVAAFLSTHFVSLGSLLVYAGVMIEVVVLGQLGYFHMAAPLLYEMYAVTAFLTIMAYIKHASNIKRLIHGEERKTYLFKKNK